MNPAVMQIVQAGLGLSLQDQGRPGWRKFGIPPSGVMDPHAAGWANRLLDNAAEAPVIECLLQGARFVMLRDAWIAITGADASTEVPLWRATWMRAGDAIEFPRNRSGVWTYIALDGGFAAPKHLGSHSTYARGRLGKRLEPGDTLRRADGGNFVLPEGVASRLVPALERRDYARPPSLRVWPAPQSAQFGAEAQAAFVANEWVVSARSDRVGYRLSGTPVLPPPLELLSEPIRLGTIQVPPDGLPIITMRDGPTLGGYAKLGVLDEADVAWLAQCRPGQRVRFMPAVRWNELLS